MNRPTEQQVASLVVAKMLSDGWDVYQEVSCHDHVADIVVQRAGVVGVVEVKTALSLTLLGQAHAWLGYAHLVWAAAPITPLTSGRRFAEQMATDYGIGLIFVGADAYVNVQPRLNRHAVVAHLRAACKWEHASGEWASAGTPGTAGE